MSSFPQGRTIDRTFFWPVSPSARCPHAVEAIQELNDQSVTRMFWFEPGNDSYVQSLEKEVRDLRAQLAAKERELAEARSRFREEVRVITLPLEVESSFPVRIIEELESPFYFSGNEAEE